jgi:hypothetical protein
MDTRRYFKRLSASFASFLHSSEASQTSDAARSTREAHQRVLARQASRAALPLWTEAPDTCDVCGRHLLVGERAGLFRCGEELSLVCPLCALQPSFEGFRVPTAASEQEPESRHHPRAA